MHAVELSNEMANFNAVWILFQASPLSQQNTIKSSPKSKTIDFRSSLSSSIFSISNAWSKTHCFAFKFGASEMSWRSLNEILSTSKIWDIANVSRYLHINHKQSIILRLPSLFRTDNCHLSPFEEASFKINSNSALPFWFIVTIAAASYMVLK